MAISTTRIINRLEHPERLIWFTLVSALCNATFGVVRYRDLVPEKAADGVVIEVSRRTKRTDSIHPRQRQYRGANEVHRSHAR